MQQLNMITTPEYKNDTYENKSKTKVRNQVLYNSKQLSNFAKKPNTHMSFAPDSKAIFLILQIDLELGN